MTPQDRADVAAVQCVNQAVAELGDRGVYAGAELAKKMIPFVLHEINAAIAEEREACAKSVEQLIDSNSSYQLMAKVAAAIRTRGKEETMPV